MYSLIDKCTRWLYFSKTRLSAVPVCAAACKMLLVSLALNSLVACSGDDESTGDQNPISPTQKSQPVEALQDISGLWDLGLSFAVVNVNIEANTDGQGGTSAQVLSIATTATWFRVASDGTIDLLVALNTNFDDADNPNCYFLEENFESWTQLADNRYRALGRTGSQDVRLRQTDTELIILQDDASIKYRRANEDELAQLNVCDNSLTGLDADDYEAQELIEVSAFSGLWKIPQSISSVNISQGTNDSTAENFIQINDDGTTSMWRFSRERECFSRDRNTGQLSFEQRDGAFIKRMDGEELDRFRVFETEIPASFGNTSFRYILFTPLDSEDPNEFYAESSLPLAPRANRCEVIADDLVDARPVENLSDAAGIWELLSAVANDERYLSLDSAGTLIRYDFRGDPVNGGQDCYLETGRSRLESLAGNRFREIENENFSEEVELFLTPLDELILLSEDKTSSEYNVELMRDDALSISMLNPLCPRVRD